MVQKDLRAEKYTIITGTLRKGSRETHDIAAILGADRLEYNYKICFHWYNVIHELGHAILHFNTHEEYTDVEEEPLVNDFAVAYWTHYGEKTKFNALQEIVRAGIARFTRPAPAGIDPVTYARENWGNEGFFSFNNYGWFQFSLVIESLQNPKPLEAVLHKMTGNAISPRPKKTLRYNMAAEDVALQVVRDATLIVRQWGVTLPILPHLLVDDPYRHGVSTVGY
jgi:hypothetical protein